MRCRMIKMHPNLMCKRKLARIMKDKTYIRLWKMELNVIFDNVILFRIYFVSYDFIYVNKNFHLKLFFKKSFEEQFYTTQISILFKNDKT